MASDNARPRVLSLLASSTEIMCALGAEDLLVGRSHECDYPESILSLPLCSEPKFLTHGSSKEIDLQVRDLVAQALSVYRVKPEELREVRPTTIITQVQCEVCAVSLKEVDEALAIWQGEKVEIVALNPNSLDDIWNDILLIAKAIGTPEKGQQLVTNLQSRLNQIHVKTSQQSLQPSVACIEWIDPLMMTANWMPELVQIAGGINLFGSKGKHSGITPLQDLAEAAPQVVVFMPCGFTIERTLQEVHALKKTMLWKELPAVKTNKVFICDGNQFFNRPGPRIVESAEILAEILHPTLFNFNHRDQNYIHYKDLT